MDMFWYAVTFLAVLTVIVVFSVIVENLYWLRRDPQKVGASVVFLMVGLIFWLTHFVMHKVRWFWTGHVTHHSSDRYNFSVALRLNFTVVLSCHWIGWRSARSLDLRTFKFVLNGSRPHA